MPWGATPLSKNWLHAGFQDRPGEAMKEVMP